MAVTLACIACGASEARDAAPWQAAERTDSGATRWHEAHAYYRAAIVRAAPRIVFFGDSIFERLGGIGADAFARRLAGRGAFLSGIDGETTQSALWRIDNGAFDDVAPRTIVVLVGTNDLPDFSPADVAHGIVRVVTRLRERVPSANVILVGLLPRDDAAVAARDGAAGAVDALLAATSFDGKVRYRNVSSELSDGAGKPLAAVLPDGLHPNARGYAAIVDALVPDLDALGD